ncbi:MAG: hypothetical protein KTR13_00915 [Saprospiraceae bacterium]|nr:hypothetical protein [Saprospiraceae bacterium]
MKSIFKLVAVLAVFAGIACQTEEVEAPIDPLFAGNGVVEKVTGSGHFTIFPDTDSSFVRTFTVSAKRFADGTVTGEWQRVRRDDGNASGDAKSHGNITCFEIVGDYAWLGGEAETGILGDVGFRVYDGGKGGKADSISLEFVARSDGFAELYCDVLVETPALNAIEAGNITIHD